MDDVQYKRIYEKAKKFAERYRFGDESSDFAQEYAIKCFELGYEKKLAWFLNDYSDKLRTSKRVLSSPSGYLSKNLSVSLDEPIGNKSDDGATISDFIGVCGYDLECVGNLEFANECLELILGLIQCPRARDEIRSLYFKHLIEAV